MFKNIKVSVLLVLLSSSLLAILPAKKVNGCSIRRPDKCIPRPIRNTPFDPNTWNPVDWIKSGAGEACEANALATAKRNIDRRRGLAPIQKEFLRPYFGNLVDEVTVKWDSLLNDKWTFKGRTIQLGSAGQTYGNTIYIAKKRQPKSTSQLVLLAHEFRHVQQYRKHGNLDNFCREYMTAYAKGGYDYENNSFERDAYNFEYKFAKELKNKLPSTGYKYTTSFPSYIKRSPIVLPRELPTELPIKYVNRINKGSYTGNQYQGAARIFSCPRGQNLNSGKKEGISAFCFVNTNSPLIYAYETGRTYEGDHKVYSCPPGTLNVESGNPEGIFSICYGNDGKFVEGKYTGRDYNGGYRVFGCSKNSVNLESSKKEGIASFCAFNN